MTDTSPSAKTPKLVVFAWFLVAYTLAAVAWGAVVRATFSGDGCGSNWPLCGGQLVPEFQSMERVFEFSHRVSTGLILPLVIVLMVGAMRQLPKGHFGRYAAYGALIMTVLEALIGMTLVKFGWVDRNESVARAGVMAFHTVSTFVLIGFLISTALALGGAQPLRVRGQGAIGWGIGLGVLLMAFLGVSGAISALGHTLWPSNDVLRSAADPASPWMVRLQPLHPLLASTVGLYLLLLSGLVAHLRPDQRVYAAVRWMVGVFGFEMALGLVNIWLKAPVWMQALHLVAADVCFAAVVGLAVSAFGGSVARREVSSEPKGEALSGRKLLNAYIVLTKPRVVSLLLFTTIMSAFAAAGGWPGGWVFVSLLLGGYLSAGAANALNMVIDRDIDGIMERTSKRPTVTQSISSTSALKFAGCLAISSFAILWLGANLLTGMLAFAGLVFYVIVYTLLLKRRTWHNIVIGGAAGAFPPLVGWAGVTGDLAPLALYLFAIILVWTPVHFWALAILIKDEYAGAGVPMLPVVRSLKFTVVQIAIYTGVTVAVTTIPFLQSYVGAPYLIASILLNVGLVAYTLRLYKRLDRPSALVLFKYSMAYLAALFLMVAIDRSVAI